MPLPDRPSLEFLRKLAKDRLAEMRRADPSARLAQAQLAVAREQGFTSWRALRAELDRRLAAAEPDAVVQLFAAIRRGDGTAVNRLLAAHPTLANARDEEGNTPLSAAVDATHLLEAVLGELSQVLEAGTIGERHGAPPFHVPGVRGIGRKVVPSSLRSRWVRPFTRTVRRLVGWARVY